MNIYSGYDTPEELIRFLKIRHFNSYENYKVLFFNKNYYAVAYETCRKEIIIGKQQVWHMNTNGYFINENLSSWVPPYIIKYSTSTNFADKIYEELLSIDNTLSLYLISNNELIKIDNPDNCFFVLLGITFKEEDVFYKINELDALRPYFSPKIIRWFRRDLLSFENLKNIALNPFHSLLRFEKNNNVNEVKYRILTDDYNGLPHLIGYNVENLEEKSLLVNERNTKPLKTVNKIKNIKSTSYILKKPDSKLNIENITDNMIISLLSSNPKVANELIRNKGLLLSKEVIDYAVNNNFDLRNYASILSDETKIISIRSNGLFVKYIDNPTLIMQIDAIHQNHHSINFINDINIEVLKEAFRKYPSSIFILNRLDSNLQRLALDVNITNIKFFKDIDEEILKEYLDKIESYKFCFNKVKNKIIFLKNKNSATSDKEYKIRIPSLERLSELYDKLINFDYNSYNYNSLIVNSEDNLDCHINYLANKLNCNNIYIACGYVHKSGLYLIEDSIDKVLNLQGTINIIIGCLQKYRSCMNNNTLLKDMDSGTAVYINQLIEKGIYIKTYENRFYHGKFYFLRGEKISCAIIGSSNISKNGFYNNFELNTLFIFKNDSEKYNEFYNWYDDIWNSSTDILNLDKTFFPNSLHEFNTLGASDRKEVIPCLREFQYLRNYQPDLEVEDIKIFEGCTGTYSAFYYESYGNLLILDSKNYENAIYIFKNVYDIEAFLCSLETKGSSKFKKEFVYTIIHNKDNSHIEKINKIFNN